MNTTTNHYSATTAHEPRNTGAGFYEQDLEDEPGSGFRDPALGPDFLDWLRHRNGLSRRGPLAAAPEAMQPES